MSKKFYNIKTLTTQERKDLFEKDTKNYLYSVMHDLVDTSFDLSESNEHDSSLPFYELFPFETLTQLLAFMYNIFQEDIILDRLHLIENELKNQMLLKTIQ